MNDKETRDFANEFTRRQWLLKLGQLTALAGMSGLAPELATALPLTEDSSALPPGLYYPSQEHLSHALVELGGVRPVPAGSETEYARPSAEPFHPKFFSDHEFRLVTRTVEILLGDVNKAALSETVQWIDLYLSSANAVREAALALNPLHRALAVAYNGEAAVRELESEDVAGIVRSGLADLQATSAEKYGRSFLDLEASQQTALLSSISAVSPENLSRKFFESIRAQAIRGYYTSGDGLRELDYKGNWYYTTCPGCKGET